MNQQSNTHRNLESDRNSSYCYFHPKEAFVGVCPVCLTERLLTLASLRQSHYDIHRTQHHHCSSSSSSNGGHSFGLTTKILALGSFLNRLELQSHESSSGFSCDRDNDDSGSTSQEDSFISIKFEDNGVALWDKDIKKGNSNQTTTQTNKAYREHHREPKSSNMQLKPNGDGSSFMNKSKSTSVIEHNRPRGGTIRWTKRIGHIFDRIRWRIATTRPNMVNKKVVVDRVKVRSRGGSWIKSFARKRRRIR